MPFMSDLFMSDLFMSDLFMSDLFMSDLFMTDLFMSDLFMSDLFMSDLFISIITNTKDRPCISPPVYKPPPPPCISPSKIAYESIQAQGFIVGGLQYKVLFKL